MFYTNNVTIVHDISDGKSYFGFHSYEWVLSIIIKYVWHPEMLHFFYYMPLLLKHSAFIHLLRG